MLKKLNNLLDELESYDDFDLKSQVLIELADEYQQVPESIAKRPYDKSNLVPGCESEVYVFKDIVDDLPHFYFAVENPQGISAKAVASIITKTVNGLASSEIKSINEEIVYKIFGKNLSMGKGLGLMNMIKIIKSLS